MDLNQGLLSSLMLSTSRVEDLCAAARQAGAFGAKLTGSGGGGCVIALASPSSVAEAHKALEALGCSAFVAENPVANGTASSAHRAGPHEGT